MFYDFLLLLFSSILCLVQVYISHSLLPARILNTTSVVCVCVCYPAVESCFFTIALVYRIKRTTSANMQQRTFRTRESKDKYACKQEKRVKKEKRLQESREEKESRDERIWSYVEKKVKVVFCSLGWGRESEGVNAWASIPKLNEKNVGLLCTKITEQ